MGITVFPGASELPGDIYPSGNDQEVQYNDAGFPGASSNFKYNSAAVQLLVGIASVGNWPSNAAIAAYGHVTPLNAGIGGYALVQDVAGATFLNATTANLVSIRVNHVAVVDIGGTYAVNVAGDVNIPGGAAPSTTFYRGNGVKLMSNFSASYNVVHATDGANCIVIGTGAAAGDKSLYLRADTAVSLQKIDGTNYLTASPTQVLVDLPFRLKAYTVATLPAGPVAGWTAYCTDLVAPAYNAIAVGGGAVIRPVFYNGTNWVT